MSRAARAVRATVRVVFYAALVLAFFFFDVLAAVLFGIQP